MLVKDMMKREVVTVAPDASLALAARQMRDRDVGCLPVIENGRLIGMITDRDIVVRGVAPSLDVGRAIVREAMSATAFTCSDEADLDEARSLMVANLIKHLPVLDSHGRVVGLVSLRDITGQHGRCSPHRVIFYKRIANSSGHVSKVEVGTVYLSPAIEQDDVIPAALAKFERDHGLARWQQVADEYELQGAIDDSQPAREEQQ